MDAPLEDCRGFGPAAFALTPASGHPFVDTCLALRRDPDLAYERSPLCGFYEAFRPRNVAEMLGFPSSHPGMQGAPDSWIYPWHAGSAAEAQRRKRWGERVRAGGAEAGFIYFGPTSPSKGSPQLARLARLAASIEAQGMRLLPGPDGLVRAEILSAGAGWRARVSVGQHRAAVLAALGRASLPVWPLPNIVRREEAADWPAVRAGTMTLSEACEVFDRQFEGVQPAALDRTKLVPAPAHGPGLPGERSEKPRGLAQRRQISGTSQMATTR